MAHWLTGEPIKAQFHRTYVVFVSTRTHETSYVVFPDGVEHLPAQPVGGDSLADLDAGLDLIRTKTGRRIVDVFIHREDVSTGDRWYAVVTSPTL